MINLQHLQDSWDSILKETDTPFIRVSLADGDPAQVIVWHKHTQDETKTKYIFTIEFESAVLMEKVEKNMGEVLTSFSSVLPIAKCDIELDLKLKKPTSVIAMAKEIFGD